VQAVEGYRPDVLVLDQNIMSTEWFKGKHAHYFPNVTFPGALFWPSREDGYTLSTCKNSCVTTSPSSEYSCFSFSKSRRLCPPTPSSLSVTVTAKKLWRVLPKGTAMRRRPEYDIRQDVGHICG
jgi:hypothetical protein